MSPSYKYHWSREELLAWERPERLSLIEWTEKNIELSRLTSAYSGRFSFDMVPFFREIAEAIDNPDIKHINIRKSTQIGGTQLMVNALAKWAATDPSSAMLCLADQDTAEEMIEDRIQPTFERSDVLRRLIIREKFNQDEIRLANDFLLKTAWASSIAKTASRPIRYLIMDEITKPGYTKTGSEGDAIARIIQRTETFSNKKIILLSTVTTEGDNMYKQEELSDEIYLYFVPCPDCGSPQPLYMRPTEYTDQHGNKQESGFVWFEANNDDKIEVAREARYTCNACGSMWDTVQKNNAVQEGFYVPQLNKVAEPSRVTFVISRLYSLFDGGRIESLTKEFLDSKEDPLLLQSFVNNSLAEYWVEVLKRTNERLIANAINNQLDGEKPPNDVVAFVVTIDVQKKGFWYILRGWTNTETSYLINYGFLKDWNEVDELIFGQKFRIWRVGIDTGGGERESGNKTNEEVYAWILKNQHRGTEIFPCKGASKELSTRCRLSAAVTKSAAGKVGLRVLQIDTNKCKDSFVWRMERAAEHDDFAAYIPPNVGKDYFAQIQAEEKRRDRKTRKMKWVAVSKNNHLFDCEAMQIAVIDKILDGGVSALKKSKTVKISRTAPKKKRKQKPQNSNPWAGGTSSGWWNS